MYIYIYIYMCRPSGVGTRTTRGACDGDLPWPSGSPMAGEIMGSRRLEPDHAQL